MERFGGRTFVTLLGVLLSVTSLAGQKGHGFSYFGNLKYPADFQHYDYVNPDAPKGGSLVTSSGGNFDSFNPVIRKGRLGAGLGWVDLAGQRLVELWAGMPTLFLLIILSGLVEPSPYWLFGLLLLFSWMPLVGVVRAEFLRARNFEYVRAAPALGLGNPSIMMKHVLPNAMVAALTLIPIMLTGSVILLTALDFLGFGLPLDSPSLGRLIQQGKSNLEAPWLGLTAFFSLSILLTLLVFIGEAFRDAFDPRKLVRASRLPGLPRAFGILPAERPLQAASTKRHHDIGQSHGDGG